MDIVQVLERGEFVKDKAVESGDLIEIGKSLDPLELLHALLTLVLLDGTVKGKIILKVENNPIQTEELKKLNSSLPATSRRKGTACPAVVYSKFPPPMRSIWS
jgi:hypothetical protein